MDRRTFLLGFLGSLAAAPAIITASSSVEAASVPEALPPVSQPAPEPVSSSGEAEVDLEKVEADWSRYGYRRRAYRRGLSQSLAERLSQGLLPQGLLPRALSSACTAGLPEGLSPPLLLDAALTLRDPRLFGSAE